VPVLKEAKLLYGDRAKGTNKTPTPHLRLKALINFLRERKEGKINENKSTETLYYELKSTARKVVDDMFNDLKKKGMDIVGMSFSQVGKIDTSIQDKYCLVLEKKALDDNGIALHLCIEMWAAELLITGILKNKQVGIGKKSKFDSRYGSSSSALTSSAVVSGSSGSHSSSIQNNENEADLLENQASDVSDIEEESEVQSGFRYDICDNI
jgi:hypothetical protein